MDTKTDLQQTLMGSQQPKAKSRVSTKHLNLCLTIVSIILIVAAIWILMTNDGDCDYSLRTWLYVITIVFLWQFVFGILFSCCVAKCPVPCATLFLISSIVTGIFHIVWFILGNIWYYGSETCEGFEDGSTLVLIILILYYIGIILGCVFLCVFCCCAGLIVAGAASAAQELKEEAAAAEEKQD
jgi:hypothetical protein